MERKQNLAQDDETDKRKSSPCQQKATREDPGAAGGFTVLLMGAVGGSPSCCPPGPRAALCTPSSQGRKWISLENEQLLAFPLAGATSAHGTAQVRLGDLADPFYLNDSLMTQCPS